MPTSEPGAESLVGIPGATNSLRSFSPVQLFFLMRLSWLQRQRRECANVLDANDWRMRLLHKALYSTYQDCLRESVGDEAKVILGQSAQTN
jgi:hypothetical protein